MCNPRLATHADCCNQQPFTLQEQSRTIAVVCLASCSQHLGVCQVLAETVSRGISRMTQEASTHLAQAACVYTNHDG